MITNKEKKVQVTVFLIVGSILIAHLLYRLLPNVFATWNAQAVDQLFLFRSNSERLRIPYNDTIVYVDLNNTSIQQLENFYLNRSYHAQVIRNLAEMNASAQLYDFIFAAKTSEAEDRELIGATAEAGNVYFGLAFELIKEGGARGTGPAKPGDIDYLDLTKWQVKIKGDPDSFYIGTNPLITFPVLSSVSRGIGYINIPFDRDGICRRLPLLVRYEGAFYPSFAFRAVCDHLRITPEHIIVVPGETITLKGARKSGDTTPRDIVIPIDKNCSMMINFLGPWERMKHYNFVDVLRASEDRDEMEMWREELTDTIVLISQVSTGSADVGPVPTDKNLPLGGVHANVINTILTEAFVRELSVVQMLLIELFLGLLISAMSLRFSAVPFGIGTLTVAGTYAFLAALCTVYASVILDMVRPLLMIAFALVSIQIAKAIENAYLQAQTQKAKEVAERDLEIGRQIQTGFFPHTLPTLPGWELAVHFRAARQVAGDFYDVFPLEDGKRVAVAVADVCDKGVGAALFMALFRSLIRVFIHQNFTHPNPKVRTPELQTVEALKKTVEFTNNYIATTHSRENMFATLFLGILDLETGAVHYVNGGHEPPVVVGQSGIKAKLNPTGPAVGALPDLDYQTQHVQLDPEDILFAYTDGLTDALSHTGESFTKERLMPLLAHPSPSAEAFLDRIVTAIYRHISGAEQYDDLTMVSVQRKLL